MKEKHHPKTFDCIGAGLCTLDRLLLLEKFPAPNQKIRALQSRACGGGPVANAIYTLARLGWKTAFIGLVGDDIEGRIIRQEFLQAGVNIDNLKVQPGGRTPAAQIWVDAADGSRTVALDDLGIGNLNFNDLDLEILQSAKFLLLDGRDADFRLAISNLVHQAGGKVVYDLGSIRSRTEEILRSADIVIASETFARAFKLNLQLEGVIREILSFGVETCVITLGERGWIWGDSNSADLGSGEAYKIKALDTTGAGDAFHGAFIHGLLNGWTTGKCAEFAGAAAALTCTILGGRGAFSSEIEILDFMNSQGRCGEF